MFPGLPQSATSPVPALCLRGFGVEAQALLKEAEAVMKEPVGKYEWRGEDGEPGSQRLLDAHVACPFRWRFSFRSVPLRDMLNRALDFNGNLWIESNGYANRTTAGHAELERKLGWVRCCRSSSDPCRFCTGVREPNRGHVEDL